MDEQIRRFTQAIGAAAPASDNKAYEKWRNLFKRPNYFLFNKKVMIVKISRSDPPFWGVGQIYINLLDSLSDYSLVLLISEREGWFFNKSNIRANIRLKKWKLREADSNYKINFPLPDRNAFYSPEHFLEIFCQHNARTSESR